MHVTRCSMQDSDSQTTPKPAPTFAHLHVHTDYSLVDGTIKIPALIAKVKELGHTHLAITDHSNMFGAVDFYSQCKKADITPIVGCDILQAGTAETAAVNIAFDDDSAGRGHYHLVLLSRNQAGYHKLAKIVSDGYLLGLSDDCAVVPHSSLCREDVRGDMIALSSSHLSEFSHLVKKLRSISGAGPLVFKNELDTDLAEKRDLVMKALELHITTVENLVGRGNYFVEISYNNLPGQSSHVEDLASAAEFFGLELIATGDCHYLEKDFAKTHALAVAIKNSLTETDIRNWLKDTEFHVLDNDEFLKKFAKYPKAISNTLKVAEMCSDLEIEMGVYHLPPFDLGTGETADEGLIRLSREGLQERIDHLTPLYEGTEHAFTPEKLEEYHKRLEHELNVIVSMGFPGYFLIVQDFINWAKQQDIPVGPGRGSGAGSLVAYALKITDLDPIPYNLIFERFLNPERVSMPDFDVDFCQWRREEVYHYTKEKYGAENVAQITTFGKLMAKGAVKSVGRAMGLGFMRVDRFTKLFPDELNISLKEALEKEPQLEVEMSKDESIRQAVDQALLLEGLTSHTSVHAAGVVISDGPMTNFVPVYTVDGESIITQYEMKRAEQVGLVKFDFLGLKTLTVVKKAVDLVREKIDPEFAIEQIDMGDKKVYSMISTGNTVGIFQCESTGMMQLIKKLQPSCFEDVVALVALFRPGPLGSGMVDDFVERKHGRQEISYPHPDLGPILQDTYGTILYQEQVQKIAAVLANYTLGEADILRRAMGKKIAAEMEKQKARFVSGSTENGIDKETAENIFDLMAEFANYGFNKSHSAAYGLVSYQTAFLKTHYPEQFMAAIMTCDLDNTKKIVRYMEDCQRMGFKILPPSINRSELEFDVPDSPSTVGFGLLAIKGTGESALKPLIAERQNGGRYTSLKDLAVRVDLNTVGKKTLELLASVGALDEFGYKRSDLLKMVKELVDYSSSKFEAKKLGQKSLFDFESGGAKTDDELEGPAPWEQKYCKLADEERPYSLEDLLTEKKLLGTFLTGHPLDFYRNDVETFGTAKLSEAPALVKDKKWGKTPVSFVCLLSEQFQRRTKAGKLIASLKLEDGYTSYEAVMFEKDILAQELPSSNTVVLAVGSVENGREGELRVTIERLYPISQIRSERVKSIELSIDTDHFVSKKGSNEGEIKTLSQFFSSIPKGQTTLNLSVNFPGAKLVLENQSFKTEVSDEFFAKLDTLKFRNVEYRMITK